jgi:hypothetical protein
MPVIPVNMVADKKKSNWKKKGHGGGKAKGVADPKNEQGFESNQQPIY